MDTEDTTAPWPNSFASFGDSQIVDIKLSETFSIVNYNILGTLICIFGIVSNIINLIVYWRIGFKASISVSLFSLTIIDLCAISLQLFLCVCQSTSIRQSSDAGLFLYELTYTVLGVLRFCLTRLSVWIAFLITVERCACIGFHSKFKEIFTPQRTAVVVVVCTVLTLLMGVPFYLSYNVGYRLVDGTNRTRLAVLTRSTYPNINTTLYLSLSSQLLSLSLIAVSICALLVTLYSQKRQLKISSAAPPPVNDVVQPTPNSPPPLPPPQRSSGLGLTQSTFLTPKTWEQPSYHHATENAHSKRPREPVVDTAEQTWAQGSTTKPLSAQSVKLLQMEKTLSHQQLSVTHRLNTPEVFVVRLHPKQSQHLSFNPDQRCHFKTPPSTSTNPGQSSLHTNLPSSSADSGQGSSLYNNTPSSVNPDQGPRRTIPAPILGSRFISAIRDRYQHTKSRGSTEVALGTSTVSRLTQQRLLNICKMVTVLSMILFISCIPTTFLLLLMATASRSSQIMRQVNLISVLWSFATLFELVNASSNIIVYYKMSTVYRKEFLQLIIACRSKTRVAPNIAPLPLVEHRRVTKSLAGRSPLVGQ